MDILLLSLLWLFCSLPLFTIGASTAALYHFTLHQAEDTEGGALKSFFSAFAVSFKKATLFWLLEVAFAAFLLFDCWLCIQMRGEWYAPVSMLALASVGLLFLLTQLYIFPIISVFSFPAGKILSNAFILSMGNLPYSIAALLLFVLAGVGSLYVPLFLPFFFGLAVFFSSYLILHVFRRYMPEDDRREPEE